MSSMLPRALVAASLLMGSLWAVPASADHLVVRRHVTLREAPRRDSAALDYPEPGTALTLLNEGRRVKGYYHVAEPDGRRGWIYQTFVERRPDASADIAEAIGPTPWMAVHYIDVDQGAAALLEFPCGAVMVDAGGRGQPATDHLLDYLRRFFARRTDLGGRLATIFVTHTHIDHNSNLRAVAEAFKIGAYVDNGVPQGSGRVAARWIREHTPTDLGRPIAIEAVEESRVTGAGAAGLTDASIDPLACQGADPAIHVLSGGYADNPGWPDGEFENGNNQSLVIRVDFGRASFLFTGDMEETAIETLVDHWGASRMLDADVWEVGHHGSHNGTTRALVAAISPKVAVISMGREAVQDRWTAWAYGHPRRDAVDMVVAGVSALRPAPVTVRVADKVKRFSDYLMSKAVYATGWDGDVTVRADLDGRIEVSPSQIETLKLAQ